MLRGFLFKAMLDHWESATLGTTPASRSWNWWLHLVRSRLSHTVVLSWCRHEFHNVSFTLLGRQCSCVHAVLGTSTFSMEYFRSKLSGNCIKIGIWMYINWGKHYPEWLTRSKIQNKGGRGRIQHQERLPQSAHAGLEKQSIYCCAFALCHGNILLIFLHYLVIGCETEVRGKMVGPYRPLATFSSSPKTKSSV